MALRGRRMHALTALDDFRPSASVRNPRVPAGGRNTARPGARPLPQAGPACRPAIPAGAARDNPPHQARDEELR